MCSIRYLKDSLYYCQYSGNFFWKHRPESHFKTQSSYKTWNTRFSGKIAGTVLVSGHISIVIKGKQHYAHRLAWLFVYGAYPSDQIDHENGKPWDNRFFNLRDVTDPESKKNMPIRKDNTSGCVGVSLHGQSGKWSASIDNNNKREFLGLFSDLKSAIEVRHKAEIENGFHVNHGKRFAGGYL